MQKVEIEATFLKVGLKIYKITNLRNHYKFKIYVLELQIILLYSPGLLLVFLIVNVKIVNFREQA